MMSRTKGGQNKKWSKEEKLRIVRRYFDEGIGRPTLAKEEGIASGMIATWIHKYLNEGEAGLENKKKSGNKFAALHRSKSMKELDRLRLIVAKQEIEIERLKKGYMVKGVGANKEFVSIKDPSTK
ncbi:transposase [Clostridium sp. JS66]|uniref:transposase n=1 Tax=Clostridium sp. JS66 TaxID=3064705 RepID=UPI00298E1EB7|nr:helix-turn-helix domain-containing protein [Clostridium sp. JS66]WPC39233.1 transposase [Clostridium sp. JS66]WPC42251.1 transposase [Clostridium sp. JS66]WPC42311.1 transposase [Clostridium sp. JS66]WPC43160.1 transposase [Clostridium sp. JS66]WPC43741.1 transposase [Clostridium sp. JS66]